MKDIKVLGVDLAKNVFQIHGADHRGKRVLSKRLTRDKLLPFIAQVKPCLIGVEACGSAHYWAREFQKLGHEVKLIPAKFVKPYVKSNKNDAHDAAAIAEAVVHPEMRFVPIKRVDQQDHLMAHRARELLIKTRTSHSNQIRGLLGEYGIVIPQGIKHVRNLSGILGIHAEKLSPQAEVIIQRLYDFFKKADEEIAVYDNLIEQSVKENAQCQALMKIEGVGPMTASAMVATVGDAKVFKNGRQMSAWIGLVPKQHSSGNRIRLGEISKRGNTYLRSLLIHGARAVVKVSQNKKDKRSVWVTEKKEMKGFNKAAVALANKNARIIWAILTSGECYRHEVAMAA